MKTRLLLFFMAIVLVGCVGKPSRLSVNAGDASTVLAVAAAYTKKYHWSEFNHMLIAGSHAGGGKSYEGYRCPETQSIADTFIISLRFFASLRENINLGQG